MRLVGPIVTRTITCLALVMCSVSVAPADPHSGVDAQLYRQSFDPNGVYFLEGAEMLPKHDFSMKLGVGFHQNPMRLPVPGIGDIGDVNDDAVLKFALALHMTMSFAITEKLQIGIDAGMYRTDPDEGYGERGRYDDDGSELSTGLLTLRPLSNIDPSGGFEPQGLAGPLDARVGFKYRLVGDVRSKLGVSALATAHIPFGDEEMFLGDSSFVLEPRLAIDYKPDPLSKTKLVANVGARFRERTVLESFDTAPSLQLTEDDAEAIYDIGSEIVAGVGFNYEALPEVIIGAEVVFFSPLPAGASFGTCRRNDLTRCSDLDDMDYFEEAGAGYGDTASFFTGGVNYRATADTTLIVAGGAGITGVRRSDFAIMGGVAWTPTPKGARTIGRGDSDGDDNPDSTDICPDEPEDKDGYQDEDGCPELDNDGDGIIDENDKCRDEPEDKDGYQDDDGCPERDNDGDNIPDVTDRCPDDAEDVDQFEDDDGCPEEDNDGDGFADADDDCPNKAETINGIDDDDGCPDARPSTGPQLAPDRIDLRGNQVLFTKNNDLTNATKAILDQIAVIMIKNNLQISVEVHVPRSYKGTNKTRIKRAQAADKRTAQKRADAIVNYLASKGAQGAQASAIGSDRPLGNNPPHDPLNERVNFIRKVQGGNP